MVASNLGRAYGIAHKVWRLANLPARFLDEMRGEAALKACQCALNYVDTPGKWTYCEVMTFQVRKYLWHWLKYRKNQLEELLGESAGSIIDRQEQECNLEVLLELLPLLSDCQRKVIELRYGLLGGRVLTYREIAACLGDASHSNMIAAEQRGIKSLRKLYRGGLRKEEITENDIRKKLAGSCV